MSAPISQTWGSASVADEAVDAGLAIRQAQVQLGLLRESAQKARRAADRAQAQRDSLNARSEELRRAVGEAKGRLEIRDAVTATLERIQTDALESTVGVYTRLLTALVQDVIDENKEIAIDLGIERGQPALSISSYVKGAPEYKSSVYENSGAMTNVVCAGLRCISVVRSGGRRLLVLDEPDCWIRGDRVEAFYRVLRGLCRDIGFQIVVISHHRPEMFGGDARVVTLGRAEIDQTDAGDAEDAPQEAKPVRRRGSKKAPPPDSRSLRTAVIREMAGGTLWENVAPVHPGIRKIEIRNLATLKDLSIELDPFLTVITGDVDIGKSRVTRAFRAIFYGDVSDEDIRHGEKGMAVAIEAENGRTLQFSREMKRNPVNHWAMTDADGETMTHDGQICSTGGRAVPDWVGHMMGIVRTDDLDLQIGHQKKPIFLLDLPATRQATVLSIGQEVQWLRAMQTKYRERVVGWNQQVKAGEAEMGTVVARLETMADLDALSGAIDKTLDNIGRAADDVESIRGRVESASKLRALAHEEARFSEISGKLQTLPKPPEMPPASEIALRLGLAASISNGVKEVERLRLVRERLADLPETPTLIDVEPHRQAAARLRELQQSISRNRQIVATLARLPEEAPALADTDGMEAAAKLRKASDAVATTGAVLKRLALLPESPQELVDSARHQSAAMLTAAQSLRTVEGHVGTAKARLDGARQQITAAEFEYDQLVAEAGDLCPVCGGPIHEADGREAESLEEAHHVHELNAETEVTTPNAAPRHDAIATFSPTVMPQPAAPAEDDFGFSIDLGFSA